MNWWHEQPAPPPSDSVEEAKNSEGEVVKGEDKLQDCVDKSPYISPSTTPFTISLTALFRACLSDISPHDRLSFPGKSQIICSTLGIAHYSTVKNWIYGRAIVPCTIIDKLILYYETRIAKEQDLLVQLRKARIEAIKRPGHWIKRGID